MDKILELIVHLNDFMYDVKVATLCSFSKESTKKITAEKIDALMQGYRETLKDYVEFPIFPPVSKNMDK